MTETTGNNRCGGYTPYAQPDRGGFGEQWIFRFANGYGASVVQGPYSYGGPAGFFELGVVAWDGDDYGLTYKTPITDDVIGWLSEVEVADLLRRIEELAPSAPEAVTP